MKHFANDQYQTQTTLADAGLDFVHVNAVAQVADLPLRNLT